jgi:hypothetical protein
LKRPTVRPFDLGFFTGHPPLNTFQPRIAFLSKSGPL